MSLDPDDIGLDLNKLLPTCAACRKQSDGAVRVLVYSATQKDQHLCGKHYDEWLQSSERKAAVWGGRPASLLESFNAFVERLRRDRYAACWRAP